MNFKKNIIVLLIAICAVIATAQQVSYKGDYYETIDPENPTFVTDLHNLIENHTILSYDYFDENYVADFASSDPDNNPQTTPRAVTCVYSGEAYEYQPPFAWTTFSREHTWCQSWMPDNSSSYGAFSDYHHLYPTNQNKANVRRSNNPLGNVENVTYQYLEGKVGTNADGRIVYQPRDSHKGDAARALFYMSVCYNGKEGKDWTFNYLKANVLDASYQSVETLLQWSQMDPPDDWERASNEYIYSIQNNRNPFVDHPEWVNYIDFNDLSYTGGTTEELALEPTYHLTDLVSADISDNTFKLNWTDAEAGTQIPSGYLLMIRENTNFYLNDGYEVADDTDFSDGKGTVNIAYEEVNNFTLENLTPGTQYYTRIYSYNNVEGAINYKTDGEIPTVTTQTSGTTPGGAGTEADPYTCARAIADNSGDNKWVIGYIVGTISSSSTEDLEAPWTKTTNLALVDSLEDITAANILAVQLPSGSLRDDLNLEENIENYGKRVKLRGDLQSYYSPRSGLKNTDNYSWSPVSDITDNFSPNKTTLHQNYPNPFNPETTINYHLPLAAHVKIAVHNAKGEKVWGMENSRQDAGNHSIKFNGSLYNSGVYYYSLQSGSKTITKKMLLIK